MIKKLFKIDIKDIEQTSEQEARENALIIKENFKDDYNLYLVDFGGYFGLSVLVYADSQRIWSDYALHHSNRAKNGTLPEYFIYEAEEVIYSDYELSQPLKNYADYRRRNDFIRDYYCKRRKYISMFHIGEFPEEQKQQIKDVYKYSSNVSFAYYADEKFVEQLNQLLEQNERLYAEFMRDDDEDFRNAVRDELANHEACITCDYTEGLAALGLKFEDLPARRKLIVLEELDKQSKNTHKRRTI